jgi:hypothetical protein
MWPGVWAGSGEHVSSWQLSSPVAPRQSLHSVSPRVKSHSSSRISVVTRVFIFSERFPFIGEQEVHRKHKLSF